MTDKNTEAQIHNKLKGASKDEAKKIIIDHLHPQCKTIGTSFFHCVEEKSESERKKISNYESLQRILNKTIIPECMQLYNLEQCLKETKK